MTRFVAVHSPKIASKLKAIPATGALNMEAMADAAPAPTRVILCLSLILKKHAIFEPILAPLITTGLSGPAEPPLAIVKAQEISLEKLDLNLKSPPLLVTL